jgi:hypothetical protein
MHVGNVGGSRDGGSLLTLQYGAGHGNIKDDELRLPSGERRMLLNGKSSKHLKIIGFERKW